MKGVGRFWGDRTGATAVEFAMVVFPFFLVVFGTIEFGRALWARETLHAVAMAGARCMGLVQSGCGTSGTYSASMATSYVQSVASSWGMTNSLGQYHREQQRDMRGRERLLAGHVELHVPDGGSQADRPARRRSSSHRLVVLSEPDLIQAQGRGIADARGAILRLDEPRGTMRNIPAHREKTLDEQTVVARFTKTRPPALKTLSAAAIEWEAAAERITVECRPSVEHCHSVEGHPRGGIVQGGFVTGWLDTAMAHACVAKSGFTVGVPSLEIKVSFLRPAHPGVVYRSRGWITRWARRIAFMEAELLDPDGVLIARASSTAALTHLPASEGAAQAG